METYAQIVEKAARSISTQIGHEVESAMILGSGLGAIANELEGRIAIPYERIPGFPNSTIPGHSGELLHGRICGKEVIVFNGRFHVYEGYSMQEVTMPVRVAKRLGVQIIIITNACGGINEDFRPGDIMLISDHINLMGGNPLTGIEEKMFGSPFVDMSDPYDSELRRRRSVTSERGSISACTDQATRQGLRSPSSVESVPMRSACLRYPRSPSVPRKVFV